MQKPQLYTFHQARLETPHNKPDYLVHACLSTKPDPHVPDAIPYWYDRGEMDKYLDFLATQLFNNTADAFDRGLTTGRRDGAVKVKAMQECVAGFVDPEEHRAVKQRAYEDGYNAASQSRTVADALRADILEKAHAKELGAKYFEGMKDRERDMIDHDIIPDEVRERLKAQFAEAHAKEIVDERRDAYQAGALYAQERIDAERGPDKGKLEARTNQLLNELYHDRSRLENVIENAIQVMEIAREDLSYTVGQLDQVREEAEQQLPEGLEDLRTNALISITAIEQFTDTHGA